MDIVEKIATATEVAPVFLSGQPGIGKTWLARETAKFLGLHSVEISCGEISEPEDFFVVPSVIDGTLRYIETPLAKAANGDEFVLILDEMNRVQNERALNLILSALDFRKEVLINKLERSYSFAKARVIATANVNGFSGFFSGTISLDKAMMSRFIRIDVPVPQWEEQTDNPELKAVLRALRGESLSYRSIAHATLLMEKGFGVEEAVRAAFITVEDDVLEEVLKNVF